MDGTGGRAVAVGLEQAAGTGDGHRHHRGTGLDGDAERTGLELACAALFALIAGAFGEDDEALAALHDGRGIVQRLDGRADVVALDENAAQQLHPAVEQRDLSQLLFRQDAVGRIQRHQKQRDVVVAAVVAHEDAGAVLWDVLLPFHHQPCAGHLQDAPAPVRDMLVDDLLHGIHVPGGEGALGPAEHTVVDDHIAKQIYKHRDRAKNAHDTFLLLA